jgi:transposase
MDIHLDILLDLPNVTVFTCEQVEGFTVLKLKLLNEGISCPHCHSYTDEVHQNRPILVRDLPISGRKIYLKVPRRQFYCQNCQRYSTERLNFLEAGRNYTLRYEDYIYEKVKELTIEQVSVKEELSYERVSNIFRKISQKKTRDWGYPERLSIDEFSRKKGKSDFVTVVSDLDRGSLLEVINSHKSEEIIKSLEKIPLKVRENVKEVCVDMWGGFPKVIKAVFPNARLVIDRFHVMKLVNKAVNNIRLERNLKGRKSRSLLLKNEEDLTEEETGELEELLKESPCLRIAYELKEELRDIYQTSTTVKMGLRKLKRWLSSAQIILGKVARTIERHLDGIANYFVQQTTSGIMEGLNNRIKLILRQSYGFKSFEMMREKLLACLFKEFEEEWEEHSILFQRNGEHCLNQLVGKDFQI